MVRNNRAELVAAGVHQHGSPRVTRRHASDPGAGQRPASVEILPTHMPLDIEGLDGVAGCGRVTGSRWGAPSVSHHTHDYTRGRQEGIRRRLGLSGPAPHLPEKEHAFCMNQLAGGAGRPAGQRAELGNTACQEYR